MYITSFRLKLPIYWIASKTSIGAFLGLLCTASPHNEHQERERGAEDQNLTCYVPEEQLLDKRRKGGFLFQHRHLCTGE